MGTIHTIPEPDATTLTPPNGTIFDLLAKHGISAMDYYTNAPSLGLYLPSLAKNLQKIAKMDQFFADAAAGKLPSFALLEPDFDKQSEENPQDISVGESFSAKVVNAVDAQPELGQDRAHLDLRRARRLLRPRAAAGRGRPRRGAAPAPARRQAVHLRPLRLPRAGRPSSRRTPRRTTCPTSCTTTRRCSACSSTSTTCPALTNRDGAADNLLDSLDLTGDPAFLTPPNLPAPKNPHPSDPIAAPICTAPGPIPNPAG